MAAASSSTTPLLLLSSPTLYRTKCDLNTIPEVARNMTWTNPFYEHIDFENDAIIAVFDIDRTIYDSNFMKLPAYIFMHVLMVTFLGIFSIYVLFPLAFNIFFYESDRRSNMLQLQRRHIAITHDGIYIDEVDKPGSTNLMSRTSIKFSDIKQCTGVTEYGWTEQSISHKINLVMKILPYYQCIVGIKQQQKFVDIVNTMMVQATTTTTEAVATLEEQTNVEPTTTSGATTNKDVLAFADLV